MQTENPPCAVRTPPFKTIDSSEYRSFLLVCPVASRNLRDIDPSIVSGSIGPLSLRVNSGTPSEVEVGSLETIRRPLSRDLQDDISGSFICGLSTEEIFIPVTANGCHVALFPIKRWGTSVCVVYQVIRCESDIDIFMEEQEFAYSCMEIQEELFLLPNIRQEVTLPKPNHDNQAPQGTSFSTEIDVELRLMDSLIQKYMLVETSSGKG
jgi:hypothetical protein